MKNLLLFIFGLSATFALSSGEYLPLEIRVQRVKRSSALHLHSPEWKAVRPLPLFQQANLPQDYHRMPVEKGSFKLLYDGKNLYLRAEFKDSEVITEAVDPQLPLMNVGDTLLLVLSPLSETGYFNIQCAPDGKIFCRYVLGFGSSRLTTANLPVKTKIKTRILIDGKLNDRKRDKAWTVFMVLPLQELAGELTAQGIDVSPAAGWSLLVGRRNYSQYIDTAENSGYPQPVRNFFLCRNIHARLRLN